MLIGVRGEEEKKKIEKELRETRCASIFCKNTITYLENSGIGFYCGKSIFDYKVSLPSLEQTVLDKTVELEKINKDLLFYE